MVPTLKQFITTEDILAEYQDTRLALYERRKQHQIKEAVERTRWSLSSRHTVMECILNKEKPLVMSERDDTAVEAETMQRLQSGVPEAGAVIDDEVKKLVRLPMVQQTTQHMQKLRRQLQEATDDETRLRAEHVEDIWLRELDELTLLLPPEELVMTMPGVVDKTKSTAAAAGATKKKRGPRKPKAESSSVVSATAGAAPKPKSAAPRKRKKKESSTEVCFNGSRLALLRILSTAFNMARSSSSLEACPLPHRALVRHFLCWGVVANVVAFSVPAASGAQYFP